MIEKPDDLTQSLHILAVVTNILLLPHLLVLALHRDGWLNQILRLCLCLVVLIISITSLALSDSHHYQPWFGYQATPAYRYPGLGSYHHYYPTTFNNYARNNLHHQVAALPVLPEVTLESSQETGPPPQPVFSPASDLLLPVISPIEEQQCQISPD